MFAFSSAISLRLGDGRSSCGRNNSLSLRCSLSAPARAAAAAKGPKLDGKYRHFLHVDDFTSEEIWSVIKTACDIKKKDLLNDVEFQPLKNKAMSMVFAKPSARTRVSFETAMYKLGGHALVLGPEVGVNTREMAKDVSRVLSGMTDLIMARLFAHDDIIEIAEWADVPVINGLTDYNHPCQIIADAMTIYEECDELKDKKVVYVGDGNNIVHSWMELAMRLPINFVCCCPKGYEPEQRLLEKVQSQGIGKVTIGHIPQDMVKDADFVYSDVWASMGQKEEIEQREKAFKDFQVNQELMNLCPNAKFLHCLPAERGRECSEQVMEADYSLVFQQAENRLHAQVAIMLKCMDVAI